MYSYYVLRRLLQFFQIPSITKLEELIYIPTPHEMTTPGKVDLIPEIIGWILKYPIPYSNKIGTRKWTYS